MLHTKGTHHFLTQEKYLYFIIISFIFLIPSFFSLRIQASFDILSVWVILNLSGASVMEGLSDSTFQITVVKK